MIDETLLRQLVRDLVGIDSVNSTLVPGARGEAVAAEFVQDFLRRHGIDADLQDAVAGRPNVVAILGASPDAPKVLQRSSEPQAPPGYRPTEDTKSTEGFDVPLPGVLPSNRGQLYASMSGTMAVNSAECDRPALAILAHIDTVGTGDMVDPFTPRERDGRLFGRGALDIKSGVAAMCAAAIALVKEGKMFSRPLLLAAVVDEECDSAGTQNLLRKYKADAAIVLEPTDLKLVIAHKGYAWYEIISHGHAAHGSLPAEGRDAIRFMGRVLTKLDEAERFLCTHAPHRLLGRASLHASLISGGQELSSYPAECRLQLECRTLPGQTEAETEAELRRLLGNLRSADPDCDATLRLLGSRPPYEISPDAPIACSAALAIREVTGRSAEMAGMAAWTDTALLWAAGIPGIVFGPTGRGLHGAEEYVELDSISVCAEVLRRLILKLCCQ